MKTLRKFLSRLLILLLVIVGAAAFMLFWPRGYGDMPPLKTGDLILQSHTSPAAWPISAATGSRYSHVGIVIRGEDGSYRVLDSAGEVKEWTLDAWLAFGHGKQFSVFRDPRLSDAQRTALLTAAQPHYGKPYDFVFLFDTETLYCSELPHLMYQALGLPIGQVQQVRKLNVNNPLVEWLIKQRWTLHPRCTEQQLDYAACRELIMTQSLISPASIARDPNLTRIYTNYWF